MGDETDRTRAGPGEKGAARARSTLRALVWNYSSAIAGTVLQLAYTAYTARAVLPSSYAAYATASSALTVVGYFAGAGLAGYLLRAEHLTRQTVRTAYRVSIVTGTLCCAATQATAPVIAQLLRMPEASTIVQLLGLFFLAQPAGNAATAALRRLGCARFCAMTDTLAQFTGMATGCALLAAGWSPYGLAATPAVTAAVTLLVAAPRLARLPVPHGPPVPARAVLGLSAAFAGYGLIQALINNVPLWAVARFLGPVTAGQFSRASLTVGLPVALLCQSLRRALVPSLARTNGEGRSLGGALPDTLGAASAIAFVSFGALAAVGPAALALLLGPGWEQACSLVPYFAAGAAFVLLCQVGHAVDEVMKALRALLHSQLLVLAGTVLFLTVVASRGPVLIAVSGAVAAAVGHLHQLVRWHRAGLCPMPSLAAPYLAHAAIGVALYACGTLGAHFGAGPLSKIAYGVLGMVPVALLCVVLRRRLPLYAAAVARGLVTG